MQRGSFESEWSGWDGYDTRGPNNVELLASGEDNIRSHLSQNASDETTPYDTNQTPSKKNLVKYTGREKKNEKSCYHTPLSLQIKRNKSDLSSAALSVSPSIRSNGSKPPRSPSKLKLPSFGRNRSFSSVSSAGSVSSRVSRKSKKRHCKNSVGADINSKSDTSAKILAGGDNESVISQNDSMSVSSFPNGSMSISSMTINKLASVAVAAAGSVLSIGGTKESAKATALAVLLSESKNSSVFNELAPAAVEAGIAVLASGMSQSSAVAVIITVLKDVHMSGCEDLSVVSSMVRERNNSDMRGDKGMSVASSSARKLNNNDMRGNEDMSVTSSMMRERNYGEKKVPENNVTFSNALSPQIDTRTKNVTPRLYSSHETNKVDCHVYVPDDVCKGCTYVPIASKISGAIEDGGTAITRSFSNLHANVITPASQNIEKGVTEFWKGLEENFNSMFENKDEVDFVTEFSSSEDENKEVARSTGIRIGSYDVCVTESNKDVEVNVTACRPYSDASGEKSKRQKSLYRARRKVGKKIGKLVGSKKSRSRHNMESANQ